MSAHFRNLAALDYVFRTVATFLRMQQEDVARNIDTVFQYADVTSRRANLKKSVVACFWIEQHQCLIGHDGFLLFQGRNRITYCPEERSNVCGLVLQCLVNLVVGYARLRQFDQRFVKFVFGRPVENAQKRPCGFMR